jgi:hypothetical protein
VNPEIGGRRGTIDMGVRGSEGIIEIIEAIEEVSSILIKRTRGSAE